MIVEHTKGPRRDGGYGGSGRSKCSMKYLLQMHNVIGDGFHSLHGNFYLNFNRGEILSLSLVADVHSVYIRSSTIA